MKAAIPTARLLLVAAAALLLAGCETEPTPKPGTSVTLGPPSATPASDLVQVSAGETLDPSLLRPPTAAYQVGPGDQLDIDLVGSPETLAAYPPNGVATVTVGPDGMIYYYILPGINVWGLTISQVRERVGQQLQGYFRQRPAVTVTLHAATSERFWILGRVNFAGVYPLNGPTTLLDAISEAGGLSSGSALAALASSIGVSSVAPGSGSESADLSHALVVRHGHALPVDFERLLREGDTSQNIFLEPDDFIYLPAAQSAQIHVLGAVVTPRALPTHGGLTLAEAVAEAGGTTPDAYLSNVAILRGSVSNPRIGIVSLAGIVRGQVPDVRLEPGDIVFVPNTPYRTLERYALLILDTFARTVGANAGAHIVSPTASGVGVSVSVSP
jgi:polysaccharide export outer membrane protein